MPVFDNFKNFMRHGKANREAHEGSSVSTICPAQRQVTHTHPPVIGRAIQVHQRDLFQQTKTPTYPASTLNRKLDSRPTTSQVLRLPLHHRHRLKHRQQLHIPETRNPSTPQHKRLQVRKAAWLTNNIRKRPSESLPRKDRLPTRCHIMKVSVNAFN